MGYLLDIEGLNIDFENGLNVRVQRSDKQKSLFKSNFDFEELGIGGLDEEFKTIFRRVFTSRMFAKKTLDKLGINHTRGMLL